MCGKALSNKTVSTIGEQKKFNYALQPMDRDDFKALVTADQPEAPDYFVHDAILNRQNRASLDEAMRTSLQPLSVDDVLRLQNGGAQIVDVRDAADYEAAHLRDVIHIALDGKYATWCGTVLDHGRRIVVIAEPGREEEAVMRLGRIGFDNVAGYLDGGMSGLETRPDLLSRTERITAQALSDLLASDDPPAVVDVRSDKEWRSGHIAGSINIPLNHLSKRIEELPSDRRFAVHCEGGYRSAIAVSFLEQAGFDNMMDLVGGYKAWQASSLPIEETEGTPTAPQTV